MCALVARGQVAASSGNGIPLRTVGSGDLNDSADAITIAAMTNEQQREPVIARLRLVANSVCGTTVCCNDCIETTIIIDVPNGKTASHPCLLEDIAGLRRR